MWHVSSRSGVATLRTAIDLLLTQFHGPCVALPRGPWRGPFTARVAPARSTTSTAGGPAAFVPTATTRRADRRPPSAGDVHADWPSGPLYSAMRICKMDDRQTDKSICVQACVDADARQSMTSRGCVSGLSWWPCCRSLTSLTSLSLSSSRLPASSNIQYVASL